MRKPTQAEMFRDRGPINHNNSPPQGYQPPLYHNERYSRQFFQPSIRKLQPRLAGPVEIPDLQVDQSFETGSEREALPIDAFEQTIVETVKESPVTIIDAQTGAGKSTRVPLMLLKAGWSEIVLTQPRRAAARNVYQRILSELTLTHGEDGHKLVSFQTAGEREGPTDAKIKIVTDGLHLATELANNQTSPGRIVILDEAHEGNTNVDVLQAIAKRKVVEQPGNRLMIMSASADTTTMATYYEDVCPTRPPVLKVPGRAHEVTERAEPKSTVTQEILLAAEKYLDSPNGNAILVFLPGITEIKDIGDSIRDQLPPAIAKQAKILPFHAKQSPAEQQAALADYPGIRIILATNVAQTSLTVPGVVCVVDSGLERRIELDEEGNDTLMIHAISQADCTQRKGRTGRVGPGEYILTRLDEKTDFIPLKLRSLYPTPEILRSDPARTTLRLAAANIAIGELDLPHAVEPFMLNKASDTLNKLGALTTERTVTALGRQMNEFPLAAHLDRMMVESKRYSARTQAYMAAISACIEAGGLPHYSYESSNRWKELSDETTSDMLMQLDIFIATQDMSDKEKQEYDLSLNNFARAKEIYGKVNRRLGWDTETLLPPNAQERDDLKQCIYAGFIDSIYIYAGEGKYLPVGDAGTLPREISRRSVVRGVHAAIVGNPYGFTVKKGSEIETIHIVEQVTTATLADIGRIASQHVEWRPDGFAMRGGKFVTLNRQYVLGTDMGVIEEVVAEPSPLLRQEILAHIMENPGSQQKILRNIKGQLELLRHKAKDPVPTFTQDQLLALLDRAAPEDITDPTLVDNNLRLIMEREQITLESFVPFDRQLRIFENAPDAITVGDVTLRLKYQSGKAIVHHHRLSDDLELNEDVFLPDGRPVWFEGEHGRLYSFTELQHLMFTL